MVSVSLKCFNASLFLHNSPINMRQKCYVKKGSCIFEFESKNEVPGNKRSITLKGLAWLFGLLEQESFHILSPNKLGGYLWSIRVPSNYFFWYFPLGKGDSAGDVTGSFQPHGVIPALERELQGRAHGVWDWRGSCKARARAGETSCNPGSTLWTISKC